MNGQSSSVAGRGTSSSKEGVRPQLRSVGIRVEIASSGSTTALDAPHLVVNRLTEAKISEVTDAEFHGIMEHGKHISS